MTDAQAARLSRGARALHELLDGQPDGARRLSQLELGSDLGVGPRQVRRYLDELEETGLVIRIRGGRGNCARYELVPSPLIGEDSSPDKRTYERTSREEHTEAMSAHNSVATESMTGQMSGHLTGHPRARAIPAGSLRDITSTPPGSPPADETLQLPVDQTGRADGVLAWFIDEWCSAGLTYPTSRFRGHLGKEIKKLLNAGFTVEIVKSGLVRMVERGVMQPALLDRFVMDAEAATRRVDKPASRRYGRGMTAAEVLRQAHAS